MRKIRVKKAERLGRCLSCNGLYAIEKGKEDGRPICKSCLAEEVSLKKKKKKRHSGQSSRGQTSKSHSTDM